MNIAIILAGGIGTRVGAPIPKQFIEIEGKPIIAYTLEKFQRNVNIDAIEIVCIESYMDKISGIASKYDITKLKWLTHGGDTFQESAMNGIFNLDGKIKDDDIVLIQFAVSPLVSNEIIDDAIQVCTKHGNAIPADEMIMCTCVKDGSNSSITSVPRETLVGLNGPWTFKYAEVMAAYKEGRDKGILSSLEPHTTSLFFALGKRIFFSKSATTNIKITRKEDLDIFEGLLLLEEKRNRLKIC